MSYEKTGPTEELNYPSKGIESSKLARNTTGSKQTQEFVGSAPSLRTKRSPKKTTQIKEEGGVAYSVKAKSFKTPMGVKPFKEDAFYKDNQSGFSGKESTDRETLSKRGTAREHGPSEKTSTSNYFSYLNEGKDKDSIWFRQLMEYDTQRTSAPKTDKWFCGWCTIRKSKDIPQ